MSTGIDATIESGYVSDNINLARLFAERWWGLVIRGIAAIGLGLFAILAPRTSMLAIVFVFAAYALVDGVVHLLTAWRAARGDRGWMVFQGLVSVAAGAFAFAWTELTALWLVMLIAAWAVLTGVAEIVAAVRLRQEIKGEWLLVTGGVLSIVFGLVLFMAPDAGVVALLWIVGIYALVFGASLIGLGLRLRAWRSGPARVPAPA